MNEQPLDYLSPRDKPRPPSKWPRYAWIAVGCCLLFSLGVCILLPSLGRAREPANRIKCGSNLSQIGKALLLYSNDEPNGAYPAGFAELLLTQDITTGVFCCPSSNTYKASSVMPTPTTQQQTALLSNPQHCSYIACFSALSNSSPAEDVLTMEPVTNHPKEDSSHTTGANVLFGDGHVQWIDDGPALQQALQDAAAGVRPVRPVRIK